MWRIENNNFLGVYRNFVTRLTWTAPRTKYSSTKKFADTNHTPLPFGIREVWILTWVRWFFGTVVHHLLSLLAFQIKSLFLVSVSRLPIYWPVLQQATHACAAAAGAAKSLQSCPTLCSPIVAAHQAPPSLGFSRQEHWSGLPFPSPMHEREKGKLL